MSEQTTQPESQENTESGATQKTAEETLYDTTDQGKDDSEEKDGVDSLEPEKEETKEDGSDDTDKSEGKDEKESDKKDSEDSKDAPETYDLKLPKDSLLDKSAVDEIAEFAKEQGLSNEQAQKLLERENNVVKDYADAQITELKEKSEQWVEDVKNDKELGGEDFNKNVEIAHRALEKFGSKQLKETLENTGLGNHPELIRAFSRIGKAMSDDSFVRPGSEGSKQKTAEEIMYGSKD